MEIVELKVNNVKNHILTEGIRIKITLYAEC